MKCYGYDTSGQAPTYSRVGPGWICGIGVSASEFPNSLQNKTQYEF